MSFTKSAAKELAPLGIRVNAVAPGIVKTERFAELYEQSGEKIDARIQRIALGRLGTPEDIAAVETSKTGQYLKKYLAKPIKNIKIKSKTKE